jgi:type IV secretion system protein VirD4
MHFYDAAEGLITATVLLVAEFAEEGERHIISVFKLIQELLAPSGVKGKNRFQLLMDMLPDEHKAKWFAGAALNTAEQAMLSVMSTALSRLNAFLDSELEQFPYIISLYMIKRYFEGAAAPYAEARACGLRLPSLRGTP